MEIDLIPCYYCGLPATAIDHVVPQKLLRMLATLEDEPVSNVLINENRVLTVHCCRECNSLLSSRYDETLLARKRRLRKILTKRYRRVLSTPNWSDEELEAMGDSVASYIRQQMALKVLVIQRLHWRGTTH